MDNDIDGTHLAITVIVSVNEITANTAQYTTYTVYGSL